MRYGLALVLLCASAKTSSVHSLHKYKTKRNFAASPEPQPKTIKKKSLKKSAPIFVIQKHNASHLHYDLRLESKGVLKSWAVPKGVPQKKGLKRLAVETEDHPYDYAHFEGTIPAGNYGAGTVEIMDRGTYIPLKKNKRGASISLATMYKKGIIEIYFEGSIISGPYALVHMSDKNWLLFKMNDKKELGDGQPKKKSKSYQPIKTKK